MPRAARESPKNKCVCFKMLNKCCYNYILVEVNMSSPRSNSNYSAVQTRSVCCKERKVKERATVSLSAAPAFPLKDFPLKCTKASRVDYLHIICCWIPKVLVN